VKYKIAIFIIISMILLISGCEFLQTTEGATRKAELAVLKQELTTDQEGNIVVSVTVKNVSQITIELAQVKVSFYNSQKAFIDSSTDSVLNLKPDDIWDFSIRCWGSCEDVESYDIEVTAGTSSGGF